MNTLPIGETCLFYEHADTNQMPCAAMVVNSTPAGVLELATFPLNSQTIVTRRNVYHVGNELLKKNKTIRMQYGGWDSVGSGESRADKRKNTANSVVERQNEDKRRREDEISKKMDEHEQKIVSLYDQSYPSSDIADIMTEQTGYTWTFQKVNGILRKHSKLVAT